MAAMYEVAFERPDGERRTQRFWGTTQEKASATAWLLKADDETLVPDSLRTVIYQAGEKA